ncbi:MAG TPA: carboxypeptidase M32 [Azospirillaceae bacterium]|nr:carboxypeptidase M32 [Azospirillaceae bacterium]
MTADAYATLERRFARLDLLSDAFGILSWDNQAMMPDGASESRAEQLAALSVVKHELLTAPDMGDLLEQALGGNGTGDPAVDGWRRANLAEMRREWLHATAVPADLVEASSRAFSKCEHVWRTARPANDFAALRPHLEEVLGLVRDIAAAKADKLGVSPYDALLDEYEPDGRSAEIDVIFDDLAAFIPGFVDEVVERQAKAPAILPLDGHYPIERQRALGIELMKAVGFDFNRGRLDVSLHPFCGGATDDVRITTRYEERNFARALMGVLHETGHAMYEQNRPRDWLRQPVGHARGMAMHESQSLIVEMQAARSRPFLSWLAPKAKAAFDGSGPAWDADNLTRIYTRVGRTLVRVDADEATYPAHVILRYRLERAMVAGDLAIADLPGAWADGLRALLGVAPPDDRLGCLQDIHWPSGGWGYFPCYTLGAMIAAQLFDTATRADPNILPALGEGDFGPLMAWLTPNVHQKASSASTRDLLIQATGRPLDAGVFKAHLRRRYLDAA